MAEKKSSRRRRRKVTIETRRKKEFTYRGLKMEELSKMSLEDVIKLLPARGRRSFLRGMNEEQRKLLERIRKKDYVKTHRRDVIILPDFVGKKIAVHMGNKFKDVEIRPEMIGHYLGEFALTRVPVKHSGPGVGATRSSKYMPLK
ncbi:MAG: 30S ribosomal protein S19 [Thermoplasmata archaeon]|nr:30S ribosomal protein S19 [Thermoplasmata archaeon]